MMRSSSLIRRARQGHVRRLSRAEYAAAMARIYQPLAPDPRTPEQIAEAQAQADLAEAVRWGFDPDTPGTLDLAIRALEAAAVVKQDARAERADVGAVLRAQDLGDLARRLRAIQEARP
jgi:hypothetical protein